MPALTWTQRSSIPIAASQLLGQCYAPSALSTRHLDAVTKPSLQCRSNWQSVFSVYTHPAAHRRPKALA